MITEWDNLILPVLLSGKPGAVETVVDVQQRDLSPTATPFIVPTATRPVRIPTPTITAQTDDEILTTYTIDTGTSIDLSDSWQLVFENDACLGFDNIDGQSSAALCGDLLSSTVEDPEVQLAEYAELRRDRIAASLQEGRINLYDLVSFGPLEQNDEMYYRLKYRLQATAETCIEDRVMLIALAHTDTADVYGVSVRIGICESAVERSSSERLTILDSFRP